MYIAEDYKKTIARIFKDLVFEEERHLYWLKGKRLPSVTGILKKHEEVFDADKVISRSGKTLIELSAAKQTRLRGEQVSVHQLRHEWQTTCKDGCELGTETHDYMEYYNGIKHPDTPQKKAGVKFLTWLLSEKIENTTLPRYTILFRELRMYSRRFMYAGTADLVLLDNLTGKLIIVDYKTNKDLWKTWKYLKEPFDYLESNPYNKYQLQFSYYQIILDEMTPYETSERWLIYLQADEQFKKYDTWDFTNELKELMPIAA